MILLSQRASDAPPADLEARVHKELASARQRDSVRVSVSTRVVRSASVTPQTDFRVVLLSEQAGGQARVVGAAALSAERGALRTPEPALVAAVASALAEATTSSRGTEDPPRNASAPRAD